MENKITYTKQGDYYLPNLKLTEQDDRPIGIWGQRRKDYLFKHRRILYTNLLTSCKLHAHLADINEEATEMFDRLVEQMAKQEGITEKLSSGALPIASLLERCCMGAVTQIKDLDSTSKAEDMMAWVARMNNIRNRAMEIVNGEIIYT